MQEQVDNIKVSIMIMIKIILNLLFNYLKHLVNFMILIINVL